uniref:Thyroglobulin type-1 domain-containing protein n=1 Tax=Oryzias latipes TaxID=8090 RepID=A0A3P9JHP5_ORYLA
NSQIRPSPCEEERRAALETSSVFVPTCERGGSYSFTQCQQGGQCWCVDPSGREVPGTRQLGGPLACGEKHHPLIANMAAGAKIHIPVCSEDGNFLPLQCVGSRCFCVDAEGRTVTSSQTAGGALRCKNPLIPSLMLASEDQPNVNNASY